MIYTYSLYVINMLIPTLAFALGWRVRGRFNQISTMKKPKIDIGELFVEAEEPYFKIKQRALEKGLSDLEFQNLRIAALRMGRIKQITDNGGYMYALQPLSKPS
jgi:hypothetical protein